LTDLFKNRLKKLRNELGIRYSEAVLITKRVNYMYISGFTGTSAIVYISENRAVLLTDFRYVEQATSQAADFEIIQYSGSAFDKLNQLIESDSIQTLYFEDRDVTFYEYDEYTAKLKVEVFLPLGKTIEKLRRVKDQWEIELIRGAVDVADKVFLHILPFIKPGVAEIELAAEMEHHMRRLGASGPSFDTIVASGQRASMPHGVASEKKIEAGDVITMDFGALYKGYCSDITRTVFLGNPDKELARIYKIVLEANQKGLEAVICGIAGRDVDDVSRQYIADQGFGDNFGHGLGHGVGLEIHEEPSLSMRADLLLEDGMVVTVEPGIYVPGLGGVRIEDMVVVNGAKADILTKASKELLVL